MADEQTRLSSRMKEAHDRIESLLGSLPAEARDEEAA